MNIEQLNAAWNEASLIPSLSTKTNQTQIARHRKEANEKTKSNFPIFQSTIKATDTDKSNLQDQQNNTDAIKDEKQQEYNHLVSTHKDRNQENNIPEYQKDKYKKYFQNNSPLKDNNFIPEKNNLAKQIKCPKLAPTNISSYKSIDMVTNEFIPEALGYIIGYGLTGKGSNDSSKVLNRMGLAGKETDRVLGSNYFVKMENPCSYHTSVDNCKGKDAYFYVRNVPQGWPKSLLGAGLLEDAMDLAPDDLIQSFYGNGKFSTKCKQRTLPVGNSINDSTKQFSNRTEYLKHGQKCIEKCKKTNKHGYPNCVKDCAKGFFLETRCTPDKDSYKYHNKEYFTLRSEEEEEERKKMTFRNLKNVCFLIILLLIIITIICLCLLHENFFLFLF